MTCRRRLASLLVGVLSASADAHKPPVASAPLLDYTPDPAFAMFHLPSAEDVKQGAVEQFGEVVILEGDSTLVSDDGSGGYGIVYDMTVQNPVDIANRFFSVYPDEFDEIILYTTFRDNGSPQALAYETSAQSDVGGIGRDKLFQQSAWGSQANFYAFVNMKWIDQYPKNDGLPITDVRSFMYPVLGQEFAHRWLSFMEYKDGQGHISNAMLGRDLAHWATTLNSDASVMDGQRWVDNGDGTFTDVEENDRYSPLDLYGMGLLPADQVPPWFLLHDAVSVRTGNRLNPTQIPQVNIKVKATRENITIAQVVAAMGPRIPAYPASEKQFRVAFVLVTRPGELAVDVLDKAALLEVVRKNWEEMFRKYTGGVGSVCTQVSAPCGTPTARVLGGVLAEAGGNGNGIIEPGEPITVAFQIYNDGVGAAEDVHVTATAKQVVFEPAGVTLPQLHAGETVTVTLHGTMIDDRKICGAPLTVEGSSAVGPHVWRGFASAVPGIRPAYANPFDDGAGYWGVDLAGLDTVHVDGWQWGKPQGYGYYSYLQFQPDTDHSGHGKTWFTGLPRGNIFTGAWHSLPKGKSTLWSPKIDLATAVHPRLRYFAWYAALDFSNPGQGPVTADEDHLILEVTNDGALWTKLDQVDGQDDIWRQRDLDLGPLLAAGRLHLDRPLQFRFTVNRDNDAELVEAGVDDFQVLSDSVGCLQPAPPDLGTDGGTLAVLSGGCSTGGPSRPSAPLGWALFGLGGLGLLVQRSRKLLRRN